LLDYNRHIPWVRARYPDEKCSVRKRWLVIERLTARVHHNDDINIDF